MILAEKESSYDQLLSFFLGQTCLFLANIQRIDFKESPLEMSLLLTRLYPV